MLHAARADRACFQFSISKNRLQSVGLKQLGFFAWMEHTHVLHLAFVRGNFESRLDRPRHAVPKGPEAMSSRAQTQTIEVNGNPVTVTQGSFRLAPRSA
jgi:hypothetical protein